MNAAEWRATGALTSLYTVRMLGLFMILPVFALYARDLPGATPMAIGLALGIYGLTQALLQIPFGIASDRFGRKPVIVVGLLLFAAGSLIAALADNLTWIIVGRALQGGGAIAAATNALLADLTRESKRTQAMLVLGIGIGASFMLALMLGPLLETVIGVPGIFGMTAGLALLCVPLLIWAVPRAPAAAAAHAGIGRDIKTVLADGQLLRLDAGIFILHAVLTALFLALPGVLEDQAGLPEARHWALYLPVMLTSLLLTIPMIHLAERRGHLKAVFLSAVALLALANAGLLLWQATLWHVAISLFVFFAAFNLLEATLPSLISRVCDAELRGAGMGVYSSSQFLGAFFGGSAGGMLVQRFGADGVFAGAALLAVCWLFLAVRLQPPVASRAVTSAD